MFLRESNVVYFFTCGARQVFPLGDPAVPESDPTDNQTKTDNLRHNFSGSRVIKARLSTANTEFNTIQTVN